jgi:hypothetical protein
MQRVSRRTLLSALGGLSVARTRTTYSQPPKSFEAFVGELAWNRELIDEFLDPDEPNWATFDSEVGYRHSNTVKRDGIDGSYCIYRTETTGERKLIHFADRPCRINTYGDSFTHCDQVNDGETWQEYLAAHFGEPVRNWIDDHRRSLMNARWFHLRRFRELVSNRTVTHYFHTNPWCHVRLNFETGQLDENENTHPTGESLYLMCDPEYVIEEFRNDVYLNLEFAIEGGTPPKLEEIKHLASLVDLRADWSTPEATSRSAEELFWLTGMKATESIVEKVQGFAEANRKNILFLVSYRGQDVEDFCKGKERLDKPFIDFLKRSGITFVDSLQKHGEDFRKFNLSPQQYVRRYYIGHYAPAGNHFFAFAVKDELIQWLTPKPFTYRHDQPSIAEISAMLAR